MTLIDPSNGARPVSFVGRRWRHRNDRSHRDWGIFLPLFSLFLSFGPFFIENGKRTLLKTWHDIIKMPKKWVYFILNERFVHLFRFLAGSTRWLFGLICVSPVLGLIIRRQINFLKKELCWSYANAAMREIKMASKWICDGHSSSESIQHRIGMALTHKYQQLFKAATSSFQPNWPFLRNEKKNFIEKIRNYRNVASIIS